MNTEQENQSDLPLDSDAAEQVFGGRSVKRQAKKSGHHLGGLPKPPQAPLIVSTPPGLFMGPDPDYPNTDTDTGDPNA
jgi:hypothetical protein